MFHLCPSILGESRVGNRHRPKRNYFAVFGLSPLSKKHFLGFLVKNEDGGLILAPTAL
jgi:hypothetical protein